MADFTMPNLGADMESATLMKWLVKPGDAVKRGDVIAEVETDKGLIEIECFETGTIEKLVQEPGAIIPVGGLMAVIQSTGAPVVRPAEPAAPATAEAAVIPAAAPMPAPRILPEQATAKIISTIAGSKLAAKSILSPIDAKYIGAKMPATYGQVRFSTSSLLSSL